MGVRGGRGGIEGDYGFNFEGRTFIKVTLQKGGLFRLYVYGSRGFSLASEMTRTVPSAISNLRVENLKLCEPSDGKNCGVESNLLIQNGFMGMSLSTREYQRSPVKTNVKDRGS